MLVGRDRELGQLTACLTAARAGVSTTVVVTGEPGVGKTSLVRELCLTATRLGVRVAAAVGQESGQGPYGAVAQLIAPFLDETDALGAKGEAVLRAVLQADGASGQNVHLVGGWLTQLLAAVAGNDGLVVVVDDAQWVDAASGEALVAATRRLLAEPVLTVVVRRAGTSSPFDGDSVQTIELQGLARGDVAVLLDQSGPTDGKVAAQIHARTGGNPLAVRALDRSLNDDQRVGRQPLPDYLPLSDALERWLSGRVAELSDPGRLIAGLVAAAGAGDPDWIERASARLRSGADAMAEVESSGIVVRSGGQLVLSHPLLRSAALPDDPAEVRAIHRALADAAGSGEDAIERRAHHLAAASLGADAEAALALDAAAARAQRQGAATEAASRWTRAAALHPDAEDAASYLWKAGDALFTAGRCPEAREVLLRAERTATDPLLLGRISLALGRIDSLDLGPITARRTLMAREVATAAFDADLAAMMAIETVAADFIACDIDNARQASERALQYAGLGRGATILPATMIDAWARLLGGDPEAQAVLEPLLAGRLGLLEMDDPDFYFAYPLITMLLMFMERFDDCREMGELSLRRVTPAGFVSADVAISSTLAEAAWRLGRWAEARAIAATMILSDATLVVAAALNVAMNARLAAGAGDVESCRRLAAMGRAEAVRLDAGMVEMWVDHADGLVALGAGDASIARTHLERVADMADRLGVKDPASVWWVGDYLDALIEVGDTARAWAVTEAQEELGARLGRRYLLGATARARGSLDAPARRGEAFDRSVEIFRELGAPFERARSLAARAAWHRDEGRTADADADTRDAVRIFDGVGAAGFSARLTRLAPPAVAVASAIDALSPAERRVALAASKGASNKEIGEQLYLSTKTVDSHLQSTFRKLGVRTRTALAARVLGEDLADA
jgi:DNA-binding CsgD family transcriptional regulator